MAQKVGKKNATVRRRREKKNIERGAAHIQSTFNNTIVTISDTQGNVVSWASAGEMGFRGSRKSTPFAAQTAAETAAKIAKDHGMKTVEVYVKGPGAGREAAGQSLDLRCAALPAWHQNRFYRLLLPVFHEHRWQERLQNHCP